MLITVLPKSILNELLTSFSSRCVRLADLLKKSIVCHVTIIPRVHVGYEMERQATTATTSHIQQARKK